MQTKCPHIDQSIHPTFMRGEKNTETIDRKVSIMSEQQRLEEPRTSRTGREPRQGPLDIPEILEMTCRYLDRHSLTMCLRVCRQWHQVLHCHVWETIDMYMGGCCASDPQISDGPSLHLLRIHASLVRKLLLCLHTTEFEFPGQHPIYCSWLTELTIVTTHFNSESLDRFLEKNLPSFIMEHRGTLKKLDCRVQQNKELTEAMMACTCLESLTTHAPYFRENQTLEDWMDWYESLGSRLRNLKLIGSRTQIARIEVMRQLFLESSVSSLRSLELTAGDSDQEAWLLVVNSPELKRLSWTNTWTFAQLAVILKNNPTEYCQKLESISIPNTDELALEDFKLVLESLPALTDLTMTGLGMIFGPISPCLTAFKLRKLKISRCSWVSDQVVHDILCSMPTLEVLSADYVSDTVIEKDPRPWVCKKLRKLTIVVPLYSGAESQTLIMDRLSQLEGLERLNLRKDTMFRGVKGYLQFGMDSGLDRLKTLRKMRIFEAPKGQTWGEPEARWALESWVHLREIDINMDDKARELLGHRKREWKPFYDSMKPTVGLYD